MSKQPPPAPTASEIGPCPTDIHIVLEVYTGSSHHPTTPRMIGVRRREWGVVAYKSIVQFKWCSRETVLV